MKCKDELEHYQRASIEKRSEFVGYDSLDLLALIMLPPEVTKNKTTALNTSEAKDLFAEGPRGNTARSLLSKDISASRMRVQYFGALLDHQVGLLARGGGEPGLVKLYNDLIDRQHRRMTNAMELLLRLDSVPTPNFRVVADKAAFVVSQAG